MEESYPFRMTLIDYYTACDSRKDDARSLGTLLFMPPEGVTNRIRITALMLNFSPTCFTSLNKKSDIYCSGWLLSLLNGGSNISNGIIIELDKFNSVEIY